MRLDFWNKKVEVSQKTFAPQAWSQTGSFAVHYDGEKNLGEIGAIKEYIPDYDGLRLRSWQAYLDSEITQTIMNKFCLWIIGSGLKLQSEPSLAVLNSEKIALKSDDFTESIEAKFHLFSKSKRADYAGLKTLNQIAKIAKKNAIIGGDVLVILRVINKEVTVQLIDGAHVSSPMYGNDFYEASKKNGNTIKNGIEQNAKGEHIAYYVRTKTAFKYERIEAKGKSSGLNMAFLVYGLEYRLNNNRGLPLIAAVLETLKKLERYKEATLGSAEERQKIALFAEHMMGSTGENPLLKNMVRASGFKEDLPVDDSGKALNDTVTSTTNKQFINMPVNSTLKQLESKNELYFKEFYAVNIDLICAAIGIPREVAMSIYDSNFSASRAALKDWEHTINVNRYEFSTEFYQPIYNLFLDVEILKNKVTAPGYLEARAKKNYAVIESFQSARFVGVGVPHIDPLKEVKAERLKMGNTSDHIPLTTVERSTEMLNGGDFKQNLSNFTKELDQTKGIKPKEPTV